MELDKLIYTNNGFRIYQCPRQRLYPDEIINNEDHIYRIEIIGKHQPTIDDAMEIWYYLLLNKIYDNKFFEYGDKMISTFERARLKRLEIKTGREMNKKTEMWDGW